MGWHSLQAQGRRGRLRVNQDHVRCKHRGMEPGTSKGLISSEAEEEVGALAAIYGNQWTHVGPATYQLAVEGPRGCPPVHVVFTLPPGYPHKDGPIYEVVGPTWWPPSSTVEMAAQFTAIVDTRMQGSPVLFECTQWVNDHVAAMGFDTSQAEVTGSADDVISEEGLRGGVEAGNGRDQWQAEVHVLDHMNDRSGYSKRLLGYANGCGLVGRLLFYAHHIVVLLAGPQRGLQEWRRLMRTSNVDVDARGRPCRERMMAMVCSSAFSGPGYEDFQVQMCLGADEVQGALVRCGLAHVYTQLGIT